MAGSYHGKLPPTIEDSKMALSHLNRTGKLATQKIAEHRAAKKRALVLNNKPSVAYNDNHIQKHEKELQKVNTSKKTLQGLRGKLKPIANQLGAQK